MTPEAESAAAARVADWPCITPTQAKRFVQIMLGSMPKSDPLPTPRQLALKKIDRMKDEAAQLQNHLLRDMESCGICGIPGKAHEYQSAYGAFHAHVPNTPDQIIKIARSYKKKIAEAEKNIAEAEALL